MTDHPPIVFTTKTKTVKITAHDIDEIIDNLCSPDDFDDFDEFIDKERWRAIHAELDELYDQWLLENPWAQPRPKNLDNSIPLDINLWSDSPSVKGLVAIVFEALDAHLGGISTRHRAIYKTSVKVVILNLLAAYKRNPEKYVACSMRPVFYKASSRYNKHKISGIIIDIIKAMAETGFIGELATGVHDPKGKKGKRTRIRAGRLLIEEFEKILASGPEAIKIEHHQEEMVLKRPKSEVKPGEPKTMEYTDNTVIPKKRNAVKRINKRLQGHDIYLELDEDQRALLAWVLSQRDQNDIEVDGEDIPHFNTAKNQLYRVYNDGSFKKGGRFYGHWVQNIPARVPTTPAQAYPFRCFLRIDGKPTVELDYSNLHPHMLYTQEGKTVPEGDLYALEGVDKAKRTVVKKLFNAMLNADSIKSAIWAVYYNPPKGYRRLTEAELREISEKIQKRHKGISHYFGTGIGLTLQYKDSTIAEGILLELDKKGIVCIPIHDSFIVQAEHEETLRLAMAGQYWEVMEGETPEVDKKNANPNHPLLNELSRLPF